MAFPADWSGTLVVEDWLLFAVHIILVYTTRLGGCVISPWIQFEALEQQQWGKLGQDVVAVFGGDLW